MSGGGCQSGTGFCLTEKLTESQRKVKKLDYMIIREASAKQESAIADRVVNYELDRVEVLTTFMRAKRPSS